MNAEELTIGDWVEFTSKYGYGKGQIDGIVPREGSAEPTTFTIWKKAKDGFTKFFVGVSKHCVRPIPLTEEILLKNGFERKSERLRHIEFELTINPNTEDEHWLVVKLHPANENCDINWAHIYFVPDSRIDLNTIETKIVNCGVHHLQHILRLCSIEKEIEL